MHPRAPRGSIQAVLLPTLLVLTGCGPSSLKIGVKSATAMNQDRPLYMVVRNIDQKTFLTESYQTVANQVIAPDPSVVQSEVVFPGSKRELVIPKQDKTPVAVYFLFTTPSTGTSWKILIDQPLPSGWICSSGWTGSRG